MLLRLEAIFLLWLGQLTLFSISLWSLHRAVAGKTRPREDPSGYRQVQTDIFLLGTDALRAFFTDRKAIRLKLATNVSIIGRAAATGLVSSMEGSFRHRSPRCRRFDGGDTRLSCQPSGSR